MGWPERDIAQAAGFIAPPGYSRHRPESTVPELGATPQTCLCDRHRGLPALRREAQGDREHRGAAGHRADTGAPRMQYRVGRSGKSEPGAAPGRSSVLTASSSSSIPTPRCGTGGSWQGSGCAGICRRKGKIRMLDRGGGRSGQPCWSPRSAVIGPASDCPSGFGAGIMAAYMHYPRVGFLIRNRTFVEALNPSDFINC